MNKQKYYIVKLVCLALLMASASISATPKQLQCKTVSQNPNNIQCAYQVKGQQINNPSSISKLYAMTNMPYALCSKARCKMKSTHSDYAKCICAIYGIQTKGKKASWQAASVGPKIFYRSRASIRRNKLHKVTSNFSMANAKNFGKNAHATCQFSKPMPWANCFGIKCKVKYLQKNGKSIPMAKCRCPVVKTKRFISIGPKNTAQCKTSDGIIWSAATSGQGDNDAGVMKDMYRRYYPGSAPTHK